MMNRRDDLGIWRSITVKRLREILAELPDDAHVVVNRVENLSILEGSPGDEDNWTQRGYIDLGEESYY